MTSRRIISHEKNILDTDERDGKATGTSEKSSVAPAVPTSVIVKLLAFTLAMFAGPLGAYFLTLNTVFKGNSTWAGATAAFTANMVLISYVIVAMKEDQSEKLAEEEKARKAK